MLITMKFVTEKAFACVALTENISGKLAQPIHEQAQNYDRQNFHKLSFGPAGLRYVSKNIAKPYYGIKGPPNI